MSGYSEDDDDEETESEDELKELWSGETDIFGYRMVRDGNGEALCEEPDEYKPWTCTPETDGRGKIRMKTLRAMAILLNRCENEWQDDLGHGNPYGQLKKMCEELLRVCAGYNTGNLQDVSKHVMIDAIEKGIDGPAFDAKVQNLTANNVDTGNTSEDTSEDESDSDDDDDDDAGVAAVVWDAENQEHRTDRGRKLQQCTKLQLAEEIDELQLLQYQHLNKTQLIEELIQLHTRVEAAKANKYQAGCTVGRQDEDRTHWGPHYHYDSDGNMVTDSDEV
jgi:hypothetical protein